MEEQYQSHGEISLAHFGILFLDELPEFNKSALEVMRQPLEDRIVTISRVNATLTYPCNFMFISSMNPCPCGFFGSKDKECTCTPQQITRYMSKISGPLLDRIDIHIEVTPVKYKNLGSDELGESSGEIKKRVNFARKIQFERYKRSNACEESSNSVTEEEQAVGSRNKEYRIFSNSELTPSLIGEHCKLDEKGKNILQTAFDKLGLSARAYGRILKVARTIADLEDSENILPNHLAEAIQYRSLDRKYWGN